MEFEAKEFRINSVNFFLFIFLENLSPENKKAPFNFY